MSAPVVGGRAHDSTVDDAAPGTARPTAIRRGPRHWLHGYRAMMRFELLNQRTFLPVFLAVQLLLGAGMAIMYGFFLGDLPPLAMRYVVTGIPALALFPLGFLAVPTVVGDMRRKGCYDFVWSLPVPRLASAAATFTVYTLLALPGAAVALLVAVWRYDVTLQVHPSIVPAVLLASLMSASVGFGMAHAIADPSITNLIANVLVFGVLLFSPIVVPISQFPDWLAGIHHVLPFESMAVVVRAGLSDGLATGVPRAYLVLGAWTLGSWLVAARVILRRR